MRKVSTELRTDAVFKQENRDESKETLKQIHFP
jgi:hypothetical protein